MSVPAVADHIGCRIVTKLAQHQVTAVWLRSLVELAQGIDSHGNPWVRVLGRLWRRSIHSSLRTSAHTPSFQRRFGGDFIDPLYNAHIERAVARGEQSARRAWLARPTVQLTPNPCLWRAPLPLLERSSASMHDQALTHCSLFIQDCRPRGCHADTAFYLVRALGLQFRPV
jgi:hypothetical protein